MTMGPAADPSLFRPPATATREVKEFTLWNASKVKKQLAGKPAPELNAVDVDGNPLALADFKGKTVLLHFWATWRHSCRLDIPALEKLYRRYGAKDLAIVSINVNEARDPVEEFLAKNPHSYPAILTAENEMPRPYQMELLPTYIVIDRDGTITTAVEGDQGFAELRRLLNKAGLEPD